MENPNPIHRSADSSRWTDDFLDQKKFIADPTADEAIARIVAEHGPKESMRIFDLLIRNIEIPAGQLPPAIQGYLEVSCKLPEWADPAKLKIAELFFIDVGPAIFVVLYYKSLPTLYACKQGAEVLMQTGRLAPNRPDMERFTRRIAETGQFMIDTMGRGGLSPDGQGIKTTQRVRLIHAAIRHFIQMGHWDESRGKPINQEELAITLMTFCISIFEGLEKFGIKIEPERAAAYLHAWKVVGYFLGIHEDLLPDNVAEGKELLRTIYRRLAGSSEGGTLLTQGLIDFAEEVIPRTRWDATPVAIIRYLNGDEMADMLDVSTQKGCLASLVPHVLKRFFGLVEKIEDLSLPANIILNQVSKKMMGSMVGYFDTYKGRHLELNEEMKAAWGITVPSGEKKAADERI